MPNKPKSTHCRYCKLALIDDVLRGAHRACFNKKPSFDDSIHGAREAYNRRKAIQKYIREKGWTEEAAAEHFDLIARSCDCGAHKARNAKYCPVCAKARANERSAEYMAANREKIRQSDTLRHRLKREQSQGIKSEAGTCACGSKAKHETGRICADCLRAKDREAHKGVVRMVDKKCAECGRDFKGTSNAKYCDIHKRGPKRKKVQARPVIPPTWDRPVSPKQKDAMPPVDRIVNPGVEFTRLPSTFRYWRFTDPEEFDQAKARAVAEILGRKG